MKFTYEAADGYAGRPRPLYCSIPDSELLEVLHGESMDAAVRMVEEAIDEDFLQKVSASYDTADIRAKLEELQKEHGNEQ